MRRMKLRRDCGKLAKNFDQQIELLIELAGSYHFHKGEVPQSVANAIGAAHRRKKLFANVVKLTTETTAGIGLKEHVDKLMAEVDEMSKAIAEAMPREIAEAAS
jgi:hypothetical protein